ASSRACAMPALMAIHASTWHRCLTRSWAQTPAFFFPGMASQPRRLPGHTLYALVRLREGRQGGRPSGEARLARSLTFSTRALAASALFQRILARQLG